MSGRALIGGHSPFFARRSMAVCGTAGRLVFFGGVGAAGTESILDVSDACWTFDPRSMTWSEVLAGGPKPSPRRCVGIAPIPSGLYLWGGSGIAETSAGVQYTFVNDWWQFDIATGRWQLLRESDDWLQPVDPNARPRYPSPRYTPVFLSLGSKLFLFSGYTEDVLGKRKLNDAWICDDMHWSRVEESGPAGYTDGATWPGPRYGSMSASSGDKAYVFGGFADEGDHNDLWEFDSINRRWRLLSPDASSPALPLARYCGAVAFDRGRLFLFGGRSRRDPRANYNDLWVFDVSLQRWECLSANRGPQVYDASATFPAYHAKASSAVLDGHWYVWGGEGAHGHVSDFWRFSLSTLEWELLQAARPDDPTFW